MIKLFQPKNLKMFLWDMKKIKSLEISDKAIYVFTEIARALILPNHIFASNAEKQELIDFINSKIK